MLMQLGGNPFSLPGVFLFSRSNLGIASGDGDRIKRGESCFRKGEAALKKARLNAAQEQFELALEAYREAGDSIGIGKSLLQVGRSLELKGLYDQALEKYREGASQYLGFGDRNGFARCQAFLGNVAWAKGDYPDALRVFTEVLETFVKTKNVWPRPGFMTFWATSTWPWENILKRRNFTEPPSPWPVVKMPTQLGRLGTNTT